MQENAVDIIEAHVIDRTIPEDFYGKRINLAIAGFLRLEQKFGSFDALIKQITYDVEVARKLTGSDIVNADTLLKAANISPQRLAQARSFSTDAIKRDDFAGTESVWRKIS